MWWLAASCGGGGIARQDAGIPSGVLEILEPGESVGLVFGQPHGRQVGADDVRLRFSDRKRLRACAFQINVKLRVRIMRRKLIGQLQRESGFADSAWSLNVERADLRVGTRGV